jgi:hypothetical protein
MVTSSQHSSCMSLTFFQNFTSAQMHFLPAQVWLKEQGAQIHPCTNGVNQWSRTKKNSPHDSKPRKSKNDVRKGICVLTSWNRAHTPNTGWDGNELLSHSHSKPLARRPPSPEKGNRTVSTFLLTAEQRSAPQKFPGMVTQHLVQYFEQHPNL